MKKIKFTHDCTVECVEYGKDQVIAFDDDLADKLLADEIAIESESSTVFGVHVDRSNEQ